MTPWRFSSLTADRESSSVVRLYLQHAMPHGRLPGVQTTRQRSAAGEGGASGARLGGVPPGRTGGGRLEPLLARRRVSQLWISQPVAMAAPQPTTPRLLASHARWRSDTQTPESPVKTQQLLSNNESAICTNFINSVEIIEFDVQQAEEWKSQF